MATPRDGRNPKCPGFHPRSHMLLLEVTQHLNHLGNCAVDFPEPGRCLTSGRRMGRAAVHTRL